MIGFLDFFKSKNITKFQPEPQFLEFLHKYKLKLREPILTTPETIVIYALWKELQSLKESKS